MKDLFSSDDVPEFYVDSIRLGASAYTITFELGLAGMGDPSSREAPPSRRVAIVRMSPQHALIFSRLLAKNLGVYQEQAGRINVPRAVLEELGLEPE